MNSNIGNSIYRVHWRKFRTCDDLRRRLTGGIASHRKLTCEKLAMTCVLVWSGALHFHFVCRYCDMLWSAACRWRLHWLPLARHDREIQQRTGDLGPSLVAPAQEVWYGCGRGDRRLNEKKENDVSFVCVELLIVIRQKREPVRLGQGCPTFLKGGPNE